MAYRFNPDHRRFLHLLNEYEVNYMVIGGVAVNLHGYIRGTGDIDILFDPSPQNQLRLIDAVEEYGYDTTELSKRDSSEMIMVTLGDRTYRSQAESNMTCLVSRQRKSIPYGRRLRGFLFLNPDEAQSSDKLIIYLAASAKLC